MGDNEVFSVAESLDERRMQGPNREVMIDNIR